MSRTSFREPASKSNRTTWAWPLYAAAKTGVRPMPLVSQKSLSAPASRSNCTTSAWPRADASYSKGQLRYTLSRTSGSARFRWCFGHVGLGYSPTGDGHLVSFRRLPALVGFISLHLRLFQSIHAFAVAVVMQNPSSSQITFRSLRFRV